MAAAYSHPASITSSTVIRCLMTVISFVQTRLGRFRSISRPNSAASHTNSSGSTTSSTASCRAGRIASSTSTEVTAMGMPVTSSCTSSLARSSCHAVTGRDCASHRFLPSSDTEDAAVSFMEPIRHRAAHSITARKPGASPPAISYTTGRSSPAFTSSKTPIMGSITVPRAQLSI